MRYAALFLLGALVAAGCATTTPERLFAAATPTPDPSYGFTPANPIRLGHFGREGGIEASRRFIAGLRYNGRPLRVLGRSSTAGPGGARAGLIDVYELNAEGAAGLLLMYIDVYHRAPLYIPQEFTFVGAPAP